MIKLTRGLVAVVDDSDWLALSKNRWYAHGSFRDGSFRGPIYAACRRGGHIGYKVMMHRVILGVRAGKRVDHVNGDGLDNRRANLRVATPSQNAGNAQLSSKNTSGYKGVFWNRGRSRWQVQLAHVYLGLFDNLEDAMHAYDEAAVRRWGSFARTNGAMRSDVCGEPS